MLRILPTAEKAPFGAFSFARSTGLEPATSRVTGECSNQLSYDRNFFIITQIIFYITARQASARYSLI